METYSGVDVYIHIFFNSPLVGSGRLHAPAVLPPVERCNGAYLIGGWVDPRAGLDDMEN
jgi:hypothetical protein